MEKTMRIGCLMKKGCCEVLERRIPDLKPHDVLIKNVACNICTTDYGQWMGLREHQGYPRVGGHEWCGYVEEIGSEVKTCKPGDFVSVNIYLGCGVCSHCQKGEYSLCKNPPPLEMDGIAGEFGFSTHAIWDEMSIVHMNPELDPACASFLEPFSTVIRGQRKLRVKPFEDVIVIGGGTMGMLNALYAKAQGARVIVSEMMPKKVALAKKLGFEVIDPSQEDPIARSMELTEGKGADCIIVNVGNAKVNEQALAMVKEIDGRVLFFAAGYPAPALEIDSNVIHYRRIELIGTYGADCEDFELAARMLNNGMIDVSPLVEPERFPLSRMQEAFAAASTVGMYRVCVECQK